LRTYAHLVPGYLHAQIERLAAPMLHELARSPDPAPKQLQTDATQIVGKTPSRSRR
jgi:hypothetical protein